MDFIHEIIRNPGCQLVLLLAAIITPIVAGIVVGNALWNGWCL